MCLLKLDVLRPPPVSHNVPGTGLIKASVFELGKTQKKPPRQSQKNASAFDLALALAPKKNTNPKKNRPKPVIFMRVFVDYSNDSPASRGYAQACWFCEPLTSCPQQRAAWPQVCLKAEPHSYPPSNATCPQIYPSCHAPSPSSPHLYLHAKASSPYALAKAAALQKDRRKEAARLPHRRWTSTARPPPELKIVA